LSTLDTIDLQDQDAPSAQDHSRQPTHPKPLGSGRPAPHQSQSMRNAELDTRDELIHANHMSDDSLGSDFHRNGIDIVYDDHDNMIADTTMDGRNGIYGHNMGGASGEEGDHHDSEGEEMLDDDMIDKISSSPSIDDGKLLPYTVLMLSRPSCGYLIVQIFDTLAGKLLSLHWPLLSWKKGTI
jgi:hypothetical protein